MGLTLTDSERLRFLELKRKRAGTIEEPQSLVDQIPAIASRALDAANPIEQTKKFFQTDPATMQRVGGPALPILGGMAAGPIGAAAGELARQASGTVLAPDTVPQTGLGRFASTVTAGVAEEPKILEAIPGVPAVKEAVSGMLDKMGNGLAKAGQTLSGAKADILKQGAEQGMLKTYGAPSLPKAQEIFAEALGPKGQKAMKQTASEAFEPTLNKAREIATRIGTKIEQGKDVTAFEALQARQATDRVISATPITDKISREALYGWRNQFDNELASQSGKLADASRTYRRAIVKDTLLSPTRLNKSGEPSAFLPMLVGHGMIGKGIEGGLGMLTGTSPAVWGLGATAGGDAVRGLNVLGKNPEIRQALTQILEQMLRDKKK